MHANTPPEEGDAFVGGLTKCQNSQESPWSVVLSLNGKPTKFEIDTGAEVSAISQRAHREIGSPKLSLPERTLRGPSNDELSVKGQFTATLGNGNREVEQELFVFEDLHKHLLGRPAIEALDLVIRVGSVRESTKSAVSRYPNLFGALGKLNGDYTILLEEEAKPFAMTVPRRVAIPLMQPVKDERARMVKLGVITRVCEPTQWCAGKETGRSASVWISHTSTTVSAERGILFQPWNSPWHNLLEPKYSRLWMLVQGSGRYLWIERVPC